MTRVPCDWDLFLDEVRAATTQLLEYRLIKARSEMKPGTDEVAVADLKASSGGRQSGAGPSGRRGARGRGRRGPGRPGESLGPPAVAKQNPAGEKGGV